MFTFVSGETNDETVLVCGSVKVKDGQGLVSVVVAAAAAGGKSRFHTPFSHLLLGFPPSRYAHVLIA